MNHKYDMLALIQDTTHTPGPWKATPLDPYRQYSLTDNEGNEIARVLRADRSEYAVINERETRLNASLIAAAPDLLEALRFMTAFAALHCPAIGCNADEGPLVDILLDLTDGHEGDNGCLAETIEMARAAISKATTTHKEKTHTCGACGEPCFPSGPARGCSCD